ncbi:hypothetical protein FRC20_002533 [Serendipita sp. 405]|nr:hypothetical protein FRC20_002533 [Serendipita sp. 405]
MHFPKKRTSVPEISEPMDGRPIQDQPHPQMIHNLAGIAPQTAAGAADTNDVLQDPSKGVYRPASKQPTSAIDTLMEDPTGGVRPAGQAPGIASVPGAAAVAYHHQQQQQQPQHMSDTSTATGVEPRVEVVEGQLPFKEQVRAYIKVHRGTVRRDHEEKELGKAILRGDVPPQ